MVAIHASLFVFAMIKESCDPAGCRQGGVDAVPEKFLPFDVGFVRYFPGMGRFDWPVVQFTCWEVLSRCKCSSQL
ncbi:hypothetical protein MUK42_28122 [Musa troglodytarum]|uniref:Secreted protein n=1 Tax=Musa troglodytarum TaxID=320322 RepID=A0A9E7F0D1_9LILI|nr:hypothetical protein MUK42_28122 [Musa troglodytarum]